MAQSMLMSSLGGRRLGGSLSPAESLVRRLRPTTESLVLRREIRRTLKFAPTLAVFKPKTKAAPGKVDF